MLWLYLVLAAQFLNALVILWDKYLVTSSAKPVVYAFYVSILSGIVVVLLPFGVISLPNPLTLWLPIAVGLAYLLSILFLYQALQMADASDVTPVTGAAASISSFILGAYFLGEHLTKDFSIAFVLLILGMGLMSYFRFTAKTFTYSLLAGVFFGVSLILTKVVFAHYSLVDGFFWTRIANVFGGLLLLAWPANRKSILHGIKSSTSGTKYAIIINKVLAGVAFFLILLSIRIGNVSLVNAMVGIQFVFVLLFALAFSDKF